MGRIGKTRHGSHGMDRRGATWTDEARSGMAVMDWNGMDMEGQDTVWLGQTRTGPARRGSRGMDSQGVE